VFRGVLGKRVLGETSSRVAKDDLEKRLAEIRAARGNEVERMIVGEQVERAEEVWLVCV
jgi:hypothetical protein